MSGRLNAYYHRSIREFLAFVIPPGQRVLLFQHYPTGYLEALQPAQAVVIEPRERPVAEGEPETRFGFSLEGLEGAFDYVVLGDVLGFCDDIGLFLRQLTTLCGPGTRVIVLQHNYLWTPFLRLAEILGIKRPGGLANLLSKRDLVSYMTASGFQFVSYTPALLVPVRVLGLGPVVNWLARLVPLLDWLKVNQFCIFRLMPAVDPEARPSLTVCLTCRNERDNVEPLVTSIPRLTEDQEILFVEGHSTDGTREEIERVAAAYPDKGIRVIGQPGKGQGDAIREGFSRARGEIVILLEADMTSPPENVRYVYDCLRLRQAEFLEGSRFVYPLSTESMPRLNQIGNGLFATLMGVLFNQYMTDVLSGIKGIRKDDFDKLVLRWGDLGVEDPFGDFELLLGAMRLGLKGVELPIHYRPRPYGETKTRAFAHGWLLLRMFVAAYFRFRR